MLEAAITLGVLIALVVYSVRNSSKRAHDPAQTAYTDTTFPMAHGSQRPNDDGRDDARDCGPVADTSQGWSSGDCSPGDSGGGDSGGGD